MANVCMTTKESLISSIKYYEDNRVDCNKKEAKNAIEFLVAELKRSWKYNYIPEGK